MTCPARSGSPEGTEKETPCTQARQTWSVAAVTSSIAALALGAVAVPTVASAHLERPSYWPDPTVDQAGGEPTGGKVPEGPLARLRRHRQGPGQRARRLSRATPSTSPRTRSRARRSNGFRLRPSQPKKKLSDNKADKLLKINKDLAEHVRVRVDPGGDQRVGQQRPRRDHARPLHGARVARGAGERPECNPSLLQEDQSGALTPSYEYQATCPNDQNLIYVQGRAVEGDPLATPDPDRHGIPEQELGECVRCNLQLEGSGAKPEDVLLDAGNGYADPLEPDSRPGSADDTSPEDCLAAPDGPDNPCYAKHVVLRTDRSDGFVGRNFLMRGAKEHGFYTEETDGVLLTR